MVLNPPGVQPLRFEGYGPEGAAVLIECLTDDPESLRARLRRAFREYGGVLGAAGAVSYLFVRVGRLCFAAVADRSALVEAAYAAGAEDVTGARGERLEVLTDPDDFEAVRSALARAGWVPLAAEVTERPALTVALAGGAARRLRELLAALAEIDGVRHVYSNGEISEPLLARV
jgi:transcriptional/translational regulatory protein YebC/TACO1